MKRLFLVLVMVLAFAGVAIADDVALRATWTPNTDTVTVGYKIYRTDVARTLIATIPGRTTATHNFTMVFPAGSIGTLRFVMTAYSATKESGDSNEAPYPLDLTPVPAVPGGFAVQKQ